MPPKRLPPPPKPSAPKAPAPKSPLQTKPVIPKPPVAHPATATTVKPPGTPLNKTPTPPAKPLPPAAKPTNTTATKPGEPHTSTPPAKLEETHKIVPPVKPGEAHTSTPPLKPGETHTDTPPIKPGETHSKTPTGNPGITPSAGKPIDGTTHPLTKDQTTEKTEKTPSPGKPVNSTTHSATKDQTPEKPEEAHDLVVEKPAENTTHEPTKPTNGTTHVNGKPSDSSTHLPEKPKGDTKEAAKDTSKPDAEPPLAVPPPPPPPLSSSGKLGIKKTPPTHENSDPATLKSPTSKSPVPPPQPPLVGAGRITKNPQKTNPPTNGVKGQNPETTPVPTPESATESAPKPASEPAPEPTPETTAQQPTNPAPTHKSGLAGLGGFLQEGLSNPLVGTLSGTLKNVAVSQGQKYLATHNLGGAGPVLGGVLQAANNSGSTGGTQPDPNGVGLDASGTQGIPPMTVPDSSGSQALPPTSVLDTNGVQVIPPSTAPDPSGNPAILPAATSIPDPSSTQAVLPSIVPDPSSTTIVPPSAISPPVLPDTSSTPVVQPETIPAVDSTLIVPPAVISAVDSAPVAPPPVLTELISTPVVSSTVTSAISSTPVPASSTTSAVGTTPVVPPLVTPNVTTIQVPRSQALEIPIGTETIPPVESDNNKAPLDALSSEPTIGSIPPQTLQSAPNTSNPTTMAAPNTAGTAQPDLGTTQSNPPPVISSITDIIQPNPSQAPINPPAITSANTASMSGIAHVVVHEPKIDRANFASLDPDTVIEPQPKKVPEGNDWIMFLAEPHQLVKVGWWKTYGVWEEAEYYRVPCYWSADEDFRKYTPEPTLLFVAKEWMDPRYGTETNEELVFLQSHHVHTSRLFKDVGHADSWVKAQLDHHFFYGQDKPEDPSYRWIVYHPVERNPFQGRFIKSLKHRVFENIMSHLPAVNDPLRLASVGFQETTPEKIASIILAVDGDPLHRFGEADSEEYTANLHLAAKTIVTEMQELIKNLAGDIGLDAIDAAASGGEGGQSAEAAKQIEENKQAFLFALDGIKALA
ncbi:MAG: hypothetical protein MMC33_003297 [Icmadophila ericetorum]|nr:hypothetical protein [Icmadophila ericetorum]